MYRFLQRPEEGVGVPGTEVPGDGELPDMGVGNYQAWPLTSTPRTHVVVQKCLRQGLFDFPKCAQQMCPPTPDFNTIPNQTLKAFLPPQL